MRSAVFIDELHGEIPWSARRGGQGTNKISAVFSNSKWSAISASTRSTTFSPKSWGIRDGGQFSSRFQFLFFLTGGFCDKATIAHESQRGNTGPRPQKPRRHRYFAKVNDRV